MTVRQLQNVMVMIRRIKRQSPETFDTFKDELHAVIEQEPSEDLEEKPGRDGDVTTRSSEEAEYTIGKLVAFFEDRRNEPATLAQMAEAIGRAQKTVKSIVYNRHKDRFELAPKRGRNNTAYYCLAESSRDHSGTKNYLR